MRMVGLGLVFLTAACTAVGNLLMRRGVLHSGVFSTPGLSVQKHTMALGREPLFVIGVVLYGVAAVVWLRVMATEQLSTSYPIVVAITFFLVTIGALLMFQENLSFQKLAEIGRAHV